MVEKKYRRLTDEEIQWIKATFNENEGGLITLRKVLTQTAEMETPIGFYRDSWSGLDLKNLDAEGRVLAVAAHQAMLNQMESALTTLKVISEQSIEDMEAAMDKARKDSSK